MSNYADPARLAAAVELMVEGMSLRAIARITKLHKETLCSLVLNLGNGCADFLDLHVRDISCRVVEIDELYSFVQKKELAPDDDSGKVGKFWTFVAIDQETKLVPTFLVGKRDTASARRFMIDLSGRLIDRPQISTDGMCTYIDAVAEAFGIDGADFAMIHKPRRSDTVWRNVRNFRSNYASKIVIQGDPDPGRISTNCVERQNLTMRMGARRYTRSTNAHSKTLEHHVAATALHFAHYNFGRAHMTLTRRRGVATSPAMAAGIADHVWTLAELLALRRGQAPEHYQRTGGFSCSVCGVKGEHNARTCPERPTEPSDAGGVVIQFRPRAYFSDDQAPAARKATQ